VQDTPLTSFLNTDSATEYFDLDIEDYYASGKNACGFFADLGAGHEAEKVTDSSPSLQSSLKHGGPGAEQIATSREQGLDSNVDKDELALLIRVYVELLAPWIDLFDLDAYFGRTVPLDAALDVLLQYALAAVAAKQTARYVMNGLPASADRSYASVLAVCGTSSANEWFYRAASYYDRGINRLRVQLQDITSTVDSAMSTPEGFVRRSRSAPKPSSDTLASAAVSEHTRAPVSSKVHAENILSAVTIFSFYETLDDCLSKSSR